MKGSALGALEPGSCTSFLRKWWIEMESVLGLVMYSKRMACMCEAIKKIKVNMEMFVQIGYTCDKY